jgi:hypothetical protein
LRASTLPVFLSRKPSVASTPGARAVRVSPSIASASTARMTAVTVLELVRSVCEYPAGT